MASTLSFFPPITDLIVSSSIFPKQSTRIPLLRLRPPSTSFLKLLSSSARKASSSTSSSSAASGPDIVTDAVLSQSLTSKTFQDSHTQNSVSSSSKLVLVVGGSGGVGQLIVASLLQRNIKARIILRDPGKAASLFGIQDEEKLQVVKGDTRNPLDLDPSVFEGVTHVICCTGTTAFPSKRWDGDNTPERVLLEKGKYTNYRNGKIQRAVEPKESLENQCDLDKVGQDRAIVICKNWEGVRNLVSALPPDVKRIVLVSSIGVTKFNELPWSIMNLFGVLKYKKMGEDFLQNSGFPFTIIRAGRLTDGPYTSYDLNTLLKATAGQRRAVLVGQGDKLVGEVSRLVVAEACIQALDIDLTKGQIYEINSIEGEGPGSNKEKWQELFKGAHTPNMQKHI